MEEAKIVMASDALSRTAAGVVYGNISLQLGDSKFPDADWTDFVVVVLTWWCQAVLRLLRGEKGPVEVRFMEGPFLVSISVAEPEVWHVSLLEDGLTRRLKNGADVRPAPLIRSILEAADRTIVFCRRQAWPSSDLEQLAVAAAAVRQETKRLAT